MKQIAIDVKNVTMHFKMTTEKVETIKEYLIRILKKNINYTKFTALDDVSFTVYKGEKIGIIGHNGAGKSTILKLISGIMKPTNGSIEVNGSISPLLELGAGFDPDFSGLENIYLNGAILGKSKEFLDRKCKDIIEFSDLGDFIYSPLKNYSSGMRAKLGFSIASQIDPDILIVDEVLGVGDQAFKKKSFNKMRELINGKSTVILVSHNLKQIEEFSEKVIWFDKGKIVDVGKPEEICKRYNEYMNKK